ncbi:SusC/RagA family TonB-linked outer membrane protein [Psychroflexus sediminis]|uniref:TonB-linked outer membrane protein, SusC/RagA family n=1 Tax=Psychroflexus sediminis TaxID=470826 RepID=A0A1G7U2W0_9FLAO|nr:TonB-dependent receptor [Psychroflexus sediminis]SDG41833.1 TonB-linked outer membrane protein, SusC/RagA family [Psychroflexus sediminis]
MKFKINGILTLFLALVVQIGFAQTKIVTGNVTDQEGLPLPGVNILVKGEGTGTQSDFDGNYSIRATPEQTLVFRYIGFATEEVIVGNKDRINVSLELKSGELDEVVITGYSNVDKEKYTGSISSVTSEEIESVPFASFDQILQGQAAGLQVTSGSGQPGAPSRVRIRGNGSINGSNEPLYILDGIQITAGDFANLNPNDFDDVSVLKDAAATAPYGSRGANGVIVITSKKGTFNTKTNVTLRSQYGVTEVGDARFEMMNSRELLEFQRTINRNRGAGLSDEEITELSQVDTDWSEVFFRTGVTQSQELSMSGGSEKTRFFNSIQYFDQEGISPNSNLQRFSLRMNLEHRPNDKTKVGINTTTSYSKSNRIGSEAAVALYNPFAAAYLGSPYNRPYDDDGNFLTGGGRTGANTLENLLVNIRERNDFKFVGSAFVEREIVKNLTAKINLGADFRQRNTITSRDPNTRIGSTTQPGEQGLYSEGNNYFANITATTSLNYTNTWGKHTLSAGAYSEYLKTHFRSSGFTGFGINPLLVGYPAGISPGTVGNELIPTVSGSVVERGLFSYFGLADYDFDSKYGFSGSIRRDASSKFAEANRWGTFFSVAARWNISNEDFMDDIDFIDNLKLRASYGTAGNQDAIPDYAYATRYGQVTYDGTSGLAPGGLGNPDLTWEQSNQFNIGLDFSLLENRISGNLEYYNNLTTDLFITRTLSATSGSNSIQSNDGEMVNKGIDLQLSGVLVRTEDLLITLNGNLNFNKNEITDLGQVNEFESGTSIIRVGLPLGTHYVVGWSGVNPANGEPLYTDAQGNVTNQFLPNEARADFGSFNPEYVGGFGGNIKYKNWTLNTLFTYQAEYFRFNNQSFFQENPNFANFNLSNKMLTMWQQPGDITEIQNFRYNREFSSKDIEDASFIRWRNVTLAYNFSQESLENIGISNLRVYGQAQNLYTWTKFTGFDPEDDNNIAQFEYPTPRVFTFGVDLTF